MGLAVTNFFDFAPHLPFRFEAELYLGSSNINQTVLKYTVQTVKISGAECNTTNAATYYGNGYKTIPIWNVSRSMTITFEETDNLEVTRMLDEIVEQQRAGLPWVIGVHLREFDAKFNTIVSDRLYKCVLASFDDPAFSRTGNPGPATVSATFNIMSEQPWSASNVENVGAGEANESETPDLTTVLEAETKKLANSQALVAGLKEWSDEFEKAYQAGKENKSSSGSADSSLREKTGAIVQIQNTEKQVAKENGLSYAAVAMANGGEKTKYAARGLMGERVAADGHDKITKEELETARKIQADLDKAKYGKELQEFVEELSTKQYHLGGKGKDGDMSKVKGVDCSGGAGAWAERMGFNIDEGTAGASNGGLVNQLVAQGATNVGQNFDNGLKPGDILSTTKNKAGNGHAVIFLGYDGKGNMLISESNGEVLSEGVKQTSPGGRVSKMSLSKLKNDGYVAIKIMDAAKPRSK